ncbi:hypothetical protein PS838_06172 [Pseudomonas fluorescens]|nr:hypothetical protein PS838_06172 [Pseudomonas fluorescens]
MPRPHVQLRGDGLARGQQVDVGFFLPGLAKVVVQKLQHRAGDATGNVLPGRGAVAAKLCVLSLMTVAVIIPIGIQGVMPHHEPNGDFRLFIIHQDHFLVVGRLGNHRHRTHDFVGGAALLIQRVHRQPPGDLRAVQQAEVAGDEFNVLDAQGGIIAPPQQAKETLPQLDGTGLRPGVGEPDLAIPQLVIFDLFVVAVLFVLAEPVGDIVTGGHVF